MLGGRFIASKLEKTAPLAGKISNLTGFFHAKVSEIAKPSETTKPIKTDAPISEEKSPENPPNPERKEP